MSIRNNDGSIYELKKPNPLLKTQDITGDEHIVHNFVAKEEVVRYTKKKKPLVPNGAVVSTPTLPPVLESQIQAPEPKKTEILPSKEEQKPASEAKQFIDTNILDEDDNTENEEESANDTVSCWCLPGEYSQHVDNLYGEKRRNLVWGGKFMFEGIILQGNEMMFVIWTQVKINPPSIIYVRSERRWWRVHETTPQDNGFSMSCLPSEMRPSFD
jgi:hypothetical protein